MPAGHNRRFEERGEYREMQDCLNKAGANPQKSRADCP
jgi:hypothetical protein